ncbi:sensor histidine kinase [Saccharopolyspora sp. 5N708]|uniref:sensor histidine kinase n=1 Tax=Saccharopolyspora sp. 5N708 TaxID=3457424 RepID=UPI003FD25CF4
MSEAGMRLADRLRLFFAGLRPPTRRAALVDGALLVVALVVSVGGGIAVPPPGPGWLPVKLAVLVGLTTTALVLRRHHPIVSLLAAAAAAALLPPAQFLLVGMSYAAGYRIARVGHALAALAVASALYPLVGWLAYPTTYFSEPRMGLFIFLWLGMTMLLGRYRRQRRDLVVSGWERAERLEAERALVARQVRHAEQLRIARDMHDSLGHELSLIALQAGALELDRSLDERHRDLAGRLRSSTTAAMERLQDVIGLLREDTRPDTTGGGIDELVERAANVGMDVELRREGNPDHVPSEVAEVARRVVQESLTNALKHAPGNPVHIGLSYTADEVGVEVANPVHSGELASSRWRFSSGGHGLTGLAELVALAGGTLRADGQGSEFRLTARIPRRTDGTSTDADSPRIDPEPRTGGPATAAFNRFRASVRATVAVPLAAVVVIPIGLLLFIGNLEVRNTSMLPRDYDALRVGMTETAVRDRLPASEYPDAEQDDRLPRPAGADCRYYGQRSGGFGTEGLYRLCFSSGKLIAKDVLEP